MEASKTEAARHSSTAQASMMTSDTPLGACRPCNTAAALVSANAKGSIASVSQNEASASPKTARRIQKPSTTRMDHPAIWERQKPADDPPYPNSRLIGGTVISVSTVDRKSTRLNSTQ